MLSRPWLALCTWGGPLSLLLSLAVYLPLPAQQPHAFIVVSFAMAVVSVWSQVRALRDPRWVAPATRSVPQALFGLGPAATGLLFFNIYGSLELATILGALAFAACLMLSVLMALFDYRELRRT